MGLSIGMKEWASVVHALGTGRQTIMVRGYPCRYEAFFLYPTFSFYSSTAERNPEGFERLFRKDFLESARKSGAEAAARAKECYTDIDYWAELDEILPIEPEQSLKHLANHFVWSPDHIEDYKASCSRGLFIWIVRLHRFPKRITIGRTAGGGVPNYYRHPEELDTRGSHTVLSDETYETEKKTIIERCQKVMLR